VKSPTWATGILTDAAIHTAENFPCYIFAQMHSLDYLNRLRAAEIENIIRFLPKGGRVLELGAGTGRQSLELSRRGLDVTAVELASSGYASDRLFPVVDYDGIRLPFPDASFDAVFSSNALEHVGDLARMHAEIRRVLKPDGMCVHILPTHSWRFWSMLTSFPGAFIAMWRALNVFVTGRPARNAWLDAVRHVGAALLQPAHGERGHAITELWTFRPAWWRRNFAANGFIVVHDEPMGLFYTGDLVFADHLSLAARASLASVLGSACHLFELRLRPMP